MYTNFKLYAGDTKTYQNGDKHYKLTIHHIQWI